MNDCLQAENLTEVLYHGMPTPTWKPSEGPHAATLDQVFVSHQCLPSLDLSLHWKISLAFDHALLIISMQHSVIGTDEHVGQTVTLTPNQDAG
jgi:hypothetical protein